MLSSGNVGFSRARRLCHRRATSYSGCEDSRQGHKIPESHHEQGSALSSLYLIEADRDPLQSPALPQEEGRPMWRPLYFPKVVTA